MAAKPLPSQRLLNRLFSYDGQTGILTWRPRDVWMFRQTPQKQRSSVSLNWNNRFAGTAAGNLDIRGYITIKVFKRKFASHRIIWKMVHGVDPECVDHINRNRSDNRLTNLRNIPGSENSLNLSSRSNNTSGTPGVFWHSGFKRWVARIKVRGKEYALGRYGDKASAIAARKEGELRLNASPRRL